MFGLFYLGRHSFKKKKLFNRQIKDFRASKSESISLQTFIINA